MWYWCRTKILRAYTVTFDTQPSYCKFDTQPFYTSRYDSVFFHVQNYEQEMGVLKESTKTLSPQNVVDPHGNELYQRRRSPGSFWIFYFLLSKWSPNSRLELLVEITSTEVDRDTRGELRQGVNWDKGWKHFFWRETFSTHVPITPVDGRVRLEFPNRGRLYKSHFSI